MKTFTRKTVTNIKQAKKQAKALRDLRKRGGNISIHDGSKTPKQHCIATAPDEGSYFEGWDD